MAVDLDYMDRSPKGQMKQANRSGARFAVIVGDEELATDTVILRDLRSGEETRVATAALVEQLEARRQRIGHEI